MANSNGIFSLRQQLRRQRKHQADSDLCDLLPRLIIGSVVDIGAGYGGYASFLSSQGICSFGLDGTPGIASHTKGLVQECDLTQDCSRWFGCADSGLFLEVGEHIPPELCEAALENVAQIPRGRLVVSWAVPGQRGKNHVNCLPPPVVRLLFRLYGWEMNNPLTQLARTLKNWQNRIMILERS